MKHPAITETQQLRRFLSGQKDVRLAIVFGSVASGQAEVGSDLDIAVATTRPMTAARKKALIFRLAQITGRPVDLVDLATVGEPLMGSR